MFTPATRDAALLFSRIALSLLFLVMGWGKLSDYSGAVAYMAQTGAPLPALSALVATGVELGIGIALVLGVFVEPLALLLAVYTVATGFIGHHFWTMEGMLRYDMMIHFYKNIGIAGGLVALAVAGPGRFALRLRRAPGA
ncbi:DoxX family protein [Gluconacetobacter takamatsuzukensis]|uniref:DoxX family protein n=1 Tax=Gluconacetobacter takamatsuzukensis TaxID=1286190 RepID=A0A7W4KEM2_9PROT|nr:DoxX family protein [Gluconacetobacter takamatsuzukensis]MBB2205440.1 DoxX family protein [Gluconacetobacter takamatsuzukensis]